MKQVNFFSEQGTNENKNKFYSILSLLTCFTLFLSFLISNDSFYFLEKNKKLETIETNTEMNLSEDVKLLKNDLLKYNMLGISFQKKDFSYFVKANFKNGEEVSRRVSFHENELKGLDENYNIGIKRNGEKIYSNLDDIIKELKVDKSQFNKKIIPEIQYLIKVTGYDYIWKQTILDYIVSSFNIVTKENFINSFTSERKEIISEMLSDMLMNIDNVNSAYFESDKRNITFISMFNDLKLNPTEIDKKNICKIADKEKFWKKSENKEFMKALFKQNINDLINSCKY